MLSHIRAENEFCERTMEPLSGMKEAIYSEMVGYLKETDDEVSPNNIVHQVTTHTAYLY